MAQASQLTRAGRRPSRRPAGPGSARGRRRPLRSRRRRRPAGAGRTTARRARRRSPRAARRGPRSGVTLLTAAHRLGDDVDRVAHVERRPAARCIAQPGLALATTVAPERRAARSIAATLRSRIVAGQLGLQRRVGAAGAAAQPLVVELDDVGDVAEHGAHRLVGPLHVAEVARILDDHRPSGGAGPAGADRGAVASHSWTSSTRAEKARRLGRAEEVAVVLHRRAAAGRVDEDRRRRPASTASSARRGRRASSCEPGVDVQRAAARAAGAGQRRTWRRPAAISAAVARCVSRIQASITQPVNSHTSSPVGRTAGAAAQRQPGQPGPPRHQPQALGDGEQRRPGEQQAVAAEHGEARRAATAARAVLVGERVRGCPPSGGRTARRSGRPARSRGTARTSP